MDFAVLAEHSVKQRKRKKQDIARELKKLWNIKVTVIRIGALGTVTKGLVLDRRLGNKRTSGDHPNYCSVEVGQNTKKSSGDLLSLRLQWKTTS